MIAEYATIPPETAESTGFTGENEDCVNSPQHAERPLSMAWIPEALLADTIALWSETYGRPVDEAEAVEILMNVKRLGELMLTLRRESSGP